MASLVRRLSTGGADLERAGAALRAGGLVAFPTETVYGLGADGLNADAVAGIFRVKGRPPDNPLILHVPGVEAARALAAEWPPLADRLAERFWPGPLTLVVRARNEVPRVATGGLDTVAVRSPSHPVARRLVELARVPVAAPSANRSGRPSPTTADAVAEDLDAAQEPVWLVDGGACPIGVESTVLDVSAGAPVLLRPGGIGRDELEAVAGPIVDPSPGGPARSPGMRYRHYAPDRPLVLLAMDDGAAIAALRAFDLATTGLLAPHAVVVRAGALAGFDLGPDAKSAAARLFIGLRQLDRAPGLERLVAVWNNQKGVGLAVANRLERAAGEVRR